MTQVQELGIFIPEANIGCDGYDRRPLDDESPLRPNSRPLSLILPTLVTANQLSRELLAAQLKIHHLSTSPREETRAARE